MERQQFEELNEIKISKHLYMYTFAKQKYDFLSSYTTRFTDIGTLFSSGHEAKMRMKIMKRNKLKLPMFWAMWF